MAGPDEFPLTLDDLLTVLAAKGILDHLSVKRTTEGLFQASYKKPGTSAYAVSINADILVAIRGALHPGWGLSWVSVLGPEFAGLFADYESDDEEEDIM